MGDSIVEQWSGMEAGKVNGGLEILVLLFHHNHGTHRIQCWSYFANVWRKQPNNSSKTQAAVLWSSKKKGSTFKANNPKTSLPTQQQRGQENKFTKLPQLTTNKQQQTNHKRLLLLENKKWVFNVLYNHNFPKSQNQKWSFSQC